MKTATTARRVRTTGRQSPESDDLLFRRYVASRDQSLREALVERYMPLARRLAMRYRGGEEPFEDLLQVASLGLLKAIDRYDPSRGIAFSSFAVPTVVGELRRHFRDRTWAVRPPRDLQECCLEVEKAIADLSGRLGRAPTVREIAEATERSHEDILEAMVARGGQRAISLQSPRRRDDAEDETLGDSLGEDDEDYDRAEARATLHRLVGLLSERDREVLRLRFEEDLTQEQIGQIIGVSQMQVSRIIRQSISRMQQAAADGTRGDA